MTRKRHAEEHIIAVLKDAQAGISVQALCRKHGHLGCHLPYVANEICRTGSRGSARWLKASDDKCLTMTDPSSKEVPVIEACFWRNV